MSHKYDLENIRTLYNTPIEELQKKYLNTDPHDAFPFIYVGEVVNVKDTEKLGRIKVKVINLLDDINNDDIPWFLPCNSSLDGSFTIPSVGDYVEVFFERGDIYCGKYFARALNKDKIPKEGLKDYPNTMVIFKTDKGTYCTLNKKTNEFKIVQPSGAGVVLKADGSIELNGTSVSIKDSESSVITKGSSVEGNYLCFGGFSAIPVCPLTGLAHNGFKMQNITFPIPPTI